MSGTEIEVSTDNGTSTADRELIDSYYDILVTPGYRGCFLEDVINDVKEQENAVKALKGNKEAAVQTLLALKTEYKTVVGEDFPVVGLQQQPTKPMEAAKPKEAEPKPKKASATDDASALKKQTRLGLESTKEENLPGFITKSEMIKYYDVSGCYILGPWSFAIWKEIKKWFDAKITDMGVKECYFPIFAIFKTSIIIRRHLSIHPKIVPNLSIYLF